MEKKTTNKYEQLITTVPKRMYWDQCANSKVRGHNPPEYTKEELISWVTSQSHFEELYITWRDSGYLSNLRPSCDRLDNSKGYSFDNIELVTWEENMRRAKQDVRDGILGTFHTPVYQYTLEGQFVARYISQAEAERTTGANQQNISACCRGLLQHTNRFRWFFDKQENLTPIKVDNCYHRDIYCYTLEGELIEIYPELEYVAMDGFIPEKVRSVITGEYSTHNMHVFSFDYIEKHDFSVDTTYIPVEIQQLTKEGELVATFESMSKAEQSTGVRSGNISKCCNGKAKSAGGFLWKRS